MDRTRRGDRERGEGRESGRRSPRPSGDRQQVTWDSPGSSSEGLLAMFTPQELESAQQRIEQRRLAREAKANERCKNLEKKVEDLFSPAIEEVTLKIETMKEYLLTMRSETELQRTDKNLKCRELGNIENTDIRLKNTKRYYIKEVNDFYHNPDSRRSEWHNILERLEYPVKDNKSGFTEHDRELIIKNIMDLENIEMNYFDDSQEKRTKNEISFNITYVRCREAFPEYNDYKTWYGDYVKMQVNMEEYNNKWNNIKTKEFEDALERAQNYAQSLLGPQEEPRRDLFWNPFGE